MNCSGSRVLGGFGYFFSCVGVIKCPPQIDGPLTQFSLSAVDCCCEEGVCVSGVLPHGLMSCFFWAKTKGESERSSAYGPSIFFPDFFCFIFARLRFFKKVIALGITGLL